ncbi:olfactory receptor 4D1-like [Arapaima gigas]
MSGSDLQVMIMENRTINVLDALFVMGSFGLSHQGAYVTISFGIVIYCFAVGCNLVLLILITTNRSLHEPMYMFLLNLSVNDLIGISAVVPRTMWDLLSDDRSITFSACLLQATCIHMYGGATLLIMSIMAFDRYIAICYPLRYHSIMTRSCVLKLIVSAWLLDFLMIYTLFALMLRFPFCNTALANHYCDNVSLLLLTCAKDTTVNNIYGLFITGLLHSLGIFSMVFSYTWILVTCLRNKDNKESKGKALHTCATHLLVFLIYELSGLIIVLVSRFPYAPPILKKFMSMSFMIFPPSLNPVIYGVKTKAIQSKLKQAFTSRMFNHHGNISGSKKVESIA